ncbi:MAG: thioredoxin-dependent thiol peroxidase [Bacteroidota bacterium]|nr:thioredoxin-dependent thiol peroxidase [Bacteroidota bacterium]
MTNLKEGDKAPNFKVVNQNDQLLTLADFKGKKLVLFFYPKDNTPGCTAESCNLRDNYTELKSMGFEILGVSADSVQSHQKFISKFDLPFDLLADTSIEIIQSYGVWGPKKFMGKEYEGIHRTTFIIDENGFIEKVITKVKTKEHSQQIIELYK